jgi:hypothetical protein
MIGEVDHVGGIYTTIVDHICPPIDVQPDLSVFKIEFSRSPALNGQEVEIRAHIKNTGMINPKNVDVKIYDGDDLIGDQRIDVVRASGDGVIVTETFIAAMDDPDLPFEIHTIKVFVNKQRAINEGGQNYKNNEASEGLVVVPDLPMEQGERRGDEEASALYISVVGLIILVGILVIVVRTPGEYFDPKRKIEEKWKKERMREMKKRLKNEMTKKE